MAVTTRSAAPTNSEGSEDAFSSAWVPYSLPSGRRQKAAKKGLVCHFYCPAQRLYAIDAISNALTAQQRDRGTIRMVAIWMSHEGSPPLPGGLAETQRTSPPCCFAQNFRISRSAFPPARFVASRIARHEYRVTPPKADVGNHRPRTGLNRRAHAIR
jgi:hypothetical protein